MSCRGVHFTLTEEQAHRLTHTPALDNDGLMAFIEEFEKGPDGEGGDAEWVQETDKSWDAIHRCLTDGKWERGRTPFHLCILGHDNLWEGDGYIINFLEAEELEQVTAVIKGIDRDEPRRRYDAIDADTYLFPSDADSEYTRAVSETTEVYAGGVGRVTDAALPEGSGRGVQG